MVPVVAPPESTRPGCALPALITSDRLRLELITPAEAADMLAGRRQPSWDPDYPRKDDCDGVSMMPRNASPEDASWGPRHIVRAYDGLVVGSIGFYGPPSDDGGVCEAEVGYGLVETARGHGAATESLRALLTQTDLAGVRVRASVLPENAASIRVLAKCGFTELRGANEDGELVMARPAP